MGIGLNVLFVVLADGYGIWAGSLALISDARHNFSDILGLLLAWGAALLAERKPSAVALTVHLVVTEPVQRKGFIEEVSQTLSENPGNTRLLVHSVHRYQYDGLKTDHPEEWMRQRIMQKPWTKYIRLTVNTIGMFRRKAGQMIDIKLPSPESERPKEDARLTGKYLVTSVRRIFKPTRHDVVMELMKDGLGTDAYGD